MKQSIPPIPDLVAHEILIFGVIYINVWALSLFGYILNIHAPSPGLLWAVYVGRVCIGAFRYLEGRPFTFSSRRVYPPLFTASLLFLASAYAAFYFPQMNDLVGIPVSDKLAPALAWGFAIAACVFFIRQQVRIIRGNGLRPAGA
ncbi:MAG TPA: hypothetical protein VIM48_01495 [Chthoniobacterales bacterium]